jgi:hypothetical protein
MRRVDVNAKRQHLSHLNGIECVLARGGVKSGKTLALRINTPPNACTHIISVGGAFIFPLHAILSWHADFLYNVFALKVIVYAKERSAL